MRLAFLVKCLFDNPYLLAHFEKSGLFSCTSQISFAPFLLLTKSNPNATSVQTEEMCREFVRFIRRNYRKHGIHHVYFKKLGDNYNFRACWKKRSLLSFKSDPEHAMAHFMLEISRKLFLETYYSTKEFKKIKDQLQERIILRYSIKELPQ